MGVRRKHEAGDQLRFPDLQALMNAAVRNIQRKAWDCDIEATKKYYGDRMHENAQGTGTYSSPDYYWPSWYYSQCYGRPFLYQSDSAEKAAMEPAAIPDGVQKAVSNGRIPV